MKTCKTCDRSLDLHNFWRHGQAKDGLQSNCIECMSKSHAAWRSGMDPTYLDRRAARNKESMDGCRGRDPLRQMLRSIRQRALLAGLEFELSADDLVIPSHCPVLGIPLVFGRKLGPGLKERDQRPSVDRIDNSKGYTKGNIVVVSYRANRIKSDATLTELAAIAAFYGGLNAATRGLGDTPAEQCSPQLPDHLPAMLRVEEKQERPVLERQAG